MKGYDRKESGKRVKHLRELAGYSQEEILGMLNIEISQLRSIETGARGMSVDTAAELSDIFNRSLDYLYLGRDRNYPEIEKFSEDPLVELITMLDPQYHAVAAEVLQLILKIINRCEFDTLKSADVPEHLKKLTTYQLLLNEAASQKQDSGSETQN